MRVVIADDETLFRDGVAALLAGAGVDTWSEGRDARRAPPQGQADASRRGNRRHPDAADPYRRRTARGAGHPPRPPRRRRARPLPLPRIALGDEAARGALGADRLSAPRSAFRTSPCSSMRCSVSRKESAWSTRRSCRASSGGRAEPGPLDGSPSASSRCSLIAEAVRTKGSRSSSSLSTKTVETHVRHILLKLDIRESGEHHRRVLAVLAYLRR